MTTVFYWRRRNLIGVTLLLLGCAAIIEMLPLYIGQYVLLIDQLLILITPAIAGILVVFFLLLEATEQVSKRLQTSISHLYRPIVYSIIIVSILRFVTYFVILAIVLPLSVNWMVLDGSTWSYVLAQTIGTASSVVLVSQIIKNISKPQ